MQNPVAADKASWTVGSSTDCDLVVNQSVVSQLHSRLSLQDGQYVLEDMGSTNGTFVNGNRLQAHVAAVVSASDRITLGLTIAMPWPVPEAPSARSMQGDVLTIGRAPECEIRLDFPMVSWHHAQITPSGKEWIIEDLKSLNGTALNQLDNKIQRAMLQPSDEIYLGSYKIPASRILKEKKLTQGGSAFERVRFQGARMVLGRDPSSGYPLDFPMISWQHAALERSAEGIFVEDLGSRNGTYVNGVRISSKTLVRPGDEIGLGSFHFQLLEDGALAKREYSGNVTIEVSSVAVNAPNGDRLLDPVSLTVFPSELVALMGPAGAGKTTFLKAINGYTRPAEGRVLFNGADLYQFYDRFRQQMSYVPQDDIVHAQLTVGEALYFSAKLRTDLKDDEIEKRIVKVLKSLEIDDKKDTMIGSPERKVLSGGQRKRVNIAMELIAAAPVIFLDEPTSGLSSYDAENVVRVLKKLSTDEKTTIVTTIHQPSLDVFKQFDSLIMISRDKGGRGALAYFGPAHPDSIEFFDSPSVQTARAHQRDLSPEWLLSGLSKHATAEWAGNYERSRYKQLYVAERSGKVPSQPKPAAETAVRKFGLGQWWTLVRRNFKVKARDRAQATILLAQAPVLAILLTAVFKVLDFKKTPWNIIVSQVPPLEFLMVVAAVWFGCNNVTRDIVGEWTVYQRERMVSLKLPSYVFSKLTIAAVLGLFQCFVLLGSVYWMRGLQADFLRTFAMLYLSSLVGSALGLCVSARASTTEAAIAVLPLILLPIIALSGALTPLNTMPDSIRYLARATPSRWAFEADLLLEAAQSHGQPSLTDKACKQTKTWDLANIHFPIPCPEEEDAARSKHEEQNSFVEGRTPFAESITVLLGMLVFWTALALIFLKMRDV